MTERRKDLLALGLLLLLFVAVFSKILFTTQIVRAPDILNEYYWIVKDLHTKSWAELFSIRLSAGWSMFINSGYTTEGGDISLQFLKYHNLIYKLFPAPANVAWFMVLHLFFGAAGTYLYCRAIGCSRTASFVGGVIFGYSAANATLINAGHVLKIATISYAPLAFYLLERGFQRQRLFWFLSSAMVLAFQFFNYHWQIAYYTCLCLAVYGLIRFAFHVRETRDSGEGLRPARRMFLLNLALLVFFLTTVSISLAPLANWSKDTNRGVQSGANQGKGGLEREEAMSWSMPPEELATFVIPGMFGLSRQESGDPPGNRTYYWGRMSFTQTTDYMGLLPWLLAPLVLLFRRDRYTLIACVLIVGTVMVALGKYTPFYNFLYDHFPGINRFRVPKMILFMTALWAGVLAARGIDCLRDDNVRGSSLFQRYLVGITALPVVLGVLFASLMWNSQGWINHFMPMIADPTRYQQGSDLPAARWFNMVSETGVAAAFATGYCGVILVYARGWLSRQTVSLLLLLLLVVDIGRVNSRFLPLSDVPHKARGSVTPVMEFLKKDSQHYRSLPMDGDPHQYSDAELPSFFFPMPVQKTRWQDILENFDYRSAVPDMLSLKYLIMSPAQAQREAQQLVSKYSLAFSSPDGTQVVLQNRKVMPKAWLVPSVVVLPNRNERLSLILNYGFFPDKLAVVETPPPIALPAPGTTAGSPGMVKVRSYENESIVLDANITANGLLVLSEKYYEGWQAYVDGKKVEIHPVNHVLRGVYLTPGNHTVKFVFDPLPFKIGKWLTLLSFALFVVMAFREWLLKRRRMSEKAEGNGHLA